MEEVIGRSYLLCGDMRERLPALRDAGLRVHLVATDAPYHLESIVKRMGSATAAPVQFGRDGMYARLSSGFRGASWDAGDIAWLPETWRLCYELLEPGGYVIVFTGPDYHRAAMAMEQAGFLIHRPLAWMFGSGTPKGKPLPFPGYEKFRYGREAKRPGMEPIAVGQKPIATKTIIENVQRYGTGAINIDDCRIPRSDGRMGYPSTVFHSGDPVVMNWFAGLGGDSRKDEFFYCAKARAADKVFRCPTCGTRTVGMKPPCGHDPESHPTAKPLSLLSALIKMHAPPGGIVLDPFMGTGPIPQVAIANGFRAVGVERDEVYFGDALARLRHACEADVAREAAE